ncbi:MAG TPA: BamA/TamA family outer membrane protein [Rhizomicrobium sp.]|jgi:translocation and assembly module TamA
MWKRPIHLASLVVLALSIALASIGARAADPQPYTVTLDPTGNSDLDTALQTTSLLVTLRGKARAGGFAVVERAKEDIERLVITLHGFGYYKARVAIAIADKDVADPDLLQTLDAVPAGKSVEVHVKIDKGPRYTIRYLEVDGVEDAEAKLNLLSGRPVIASNVLAAGARLLTALQEDGYALAKVDPPIAYADDDAHVVDILFKATPGPRVQIGRITIAGLQDVNEGVVRDALTIQTGDRYKPSKIEEARQSVLTLGVFSGVGVHAAGKLDENGRMPLTFEVTERPAHAVSLSAAYSTDLGASLGGTWSHRNLFGNAEQLNLTALGTGLGGSATGALGYTLTAQFLKPMFLERNQTLELDAGAIKQSLIAYDQTVESIAGYLRRKFSTLWSASVGLIAEHDQVAQEGLSNTYELINLPITVNYDSTGVTGLLEDPLRGVRAAFSVIPTEPFNHASTFLTVQASGSGYIDASDWFGNKPGRSVIAVRGLVASILGASQFDLPPDQRLYVGGSGTVRGYEYQSIGPLFPSGNPIGATSADSASIEFRQRIGNEWGAAAFIDAGQASETRTPFAGTPFVGVGAGVRYYTSIGPIRADIAIPLSKPVHGDAFEIYIGLGQSF